MRCKIWRLRIGPWYLVVMKSNKIAPCGLGAALQAYIKFRPLLAQHPPHRSECPYFWTGLKIKMPMSTRLCITLLLLEECGVTAEEGSVVCFVIQ